jgi:hypothetical protein
LILLHFHQRPSSSLRLGEVVSGAKRVRFVSNRNRDLGCMPRPAACRLRFSDLFAASIPTSYYLSFCQSACKFVPSPASNCDPLAWRILAVALRAAGVGRGCGPPEIPMSHGVAPKHNIPDQNIQRHRRQLMMNARGNPVRRRIVTDRLAAVMKTVRQVDQTDAGAGPGHPMRPQAPRDNCRTFQTTDRV